MSVKVQLLQVKSWNIHYEIKSNSIFALGYCIGKAYILRDSLQDTQNYPPAYSTSIIFPVFLSTSWSLTS